MKPPKPTRQPHFDANKFRELILYIAHQSKEDDYFGATKLNKILFFADFLSYGLIGKSITGATYVRRRNGPVPLQLKPVEREIKESGDGAILERPFFNLTQRRLIPKRVARTGLFSAEEIDLVNDVIHNLAAYNASKASYLSHKRSFAWQVAEEGEHIPYQAVFLSSRKATAKDVARGKALAKRYGWLKPNIAS